VEERWNGFGHGSGERHQTWQAVRAPAESHKRRRSLVLHGQRRYSWGRALEERRDIIGHRSGARYQVGLEELLSKLAQGRRRNTLRRELTEPAMGRFEDPPPSTPRAERALMVPLEDETRTLVLYPPLRCLL